jgi:hypothetical protein
MTEFEKNRIKVSRLIRSKDNNIDFNSTIYRILPLDHIHKFAFRKEIFNG